MTHASLFSGIGACELAATRNGIENVFHCEINDFCRTFLEKKYGGQSFSDITTTDFRSFRGKIDILSGGFPCQDASKAKQDGKGQRGLDGERTGLWRHMVRAIHEIRPRYVVAENVANLLRINEGRDFAIILYTLSRMGYNAEWRTCNGKEVGLCNERKRVWIVAQRIDTSCSRLQQGQYKSFFGYVDKEGRCKSLRKSPGTALSYWSAWGGELQVSAPDHGIPRRLLRGSSLSTMRKNIFQAIGNSMHPQVPELIFKSIKEKSL